MTEPLALCTLLAIGVTCWGSYLGFRHPGFEARHIFWPEAILVRREYRRLITSGLLHADGMHLLVNMVSLYLFGSAIELVFGPLWFLIIYGASLMGGGLLSLWIHRHHDYRAYGASGGVCGIVFAHIFLFPGGTICMYFIPIGIPSWLYAVGFLAASFYGLKKGRDCIGHDAHIGGALSGVCATVFLSPWIVRSSPYLFGMVVGGSILALLVLAKHPLHVPWPKVRLRGRWAGKSATPLPEYKQKERKLDAILQKISEDGLESLTVEESAFLQETSAKYRRRAETKKPESELAI